MDSQSIPADAFSATTIANKRGTLVREPPLPILYRPAPVPADDPDLRRFVTETAIRESGTRCREP